MANNTNFAEGKIVFYDGSSETFSTLPELLELVYMREREKSLIRQIEVGGLDPKGSAIQAVFDFNCLTCGIGKPETMEPANRYQRMLGEILLTDGVITQEQLDQALEAQKSGHGEERIGKVFTRLGFASAKEIYSALGKQYGISDS